MKKFKHIFAGNNRLKFTFILLIFAVFITVFATEWPTKLFAQDNDECLSCHEDNELTMEKNGKTRSLFVNNKKLKRSIHAGVKCVDCHKDFDPYDLPHKADDLTVDCGSCHKEEKKLYQDCLHGKSKAKGDPLAPTCKTCHGTHEVLSQKDHKSPIYPLNVPQLCGKCHKEGSPVQLQRNIPQTHILENYSLSIHGEGLIKKGLTVSATCASCHSAHRILPHTDSRSTINRKNIAATCATCHASIEDVHQKVIKGELWEKEANVLPACIDCHQPHKVRKVFYEQNLSDASCRNCHENQSIGKSKDGRNMFVDHSDIISSVHFKTACTQCHVAVDPSHDRPCDALKENKVDCSGCHSEVGDDYTMSIHGQQKMRGNPNAPLCKDCHGTHKILAKSNEKSKIFPINIPKLCSQCHIEGKVTVRNNKLNKDKINNYHESIHGKGLSESGLTVSATCADCHTAHKQQPESEPTSSVNPKNVASTCANCHFGIKEIFDKSIHSPLLSDSDKKLPSCNDCHSAHMIKRTDLDEFRHNISSTCGKCHGEITSTYFETYHGKATYLGSDKAAKCSDCHGAHNILPPDNLNSTLSRQNILATCQSCHPTATKGFTKYLTHATHHDSVKYPILFYTFWGMTLLLLTTFTVSFIHTLLWLPRSLKMRKQMKALHSKSHDPNEKLYQRFTGFNRMLHFIMIASFITLAATGMLLKFSYTTWAHLFTGMLGGVENAGFLHRIAATALFGIFVAHIWDLFRKKKNEFTSWKAMLLGPDSMLPNKKDIQDVKASFKWFLGKGPRPEYDRWTYWEKFDYFAVFWGIFVIGGTGLALWFPEILTAIVPGWLINVATIIHSDEALLATGFIFTVHFFNTHFRPEKFPMDTVIFSGQMTIEELKLERPAEYARMVESGKLEQYMTPRFSRRMLRVLKVFGWIALCSGIYMVGWIIYAMLFS